jgi:hypothetical protein
MIRTVTLIVLDVEGELLGTLDPFEVETPWWQQTSDVGPVVQERYGLTVDVLRLLDTEHPQAPGGRVTYLAQLRHPATKPRLKAVEPELVALINQDEPQRAPYARPGGPAASLAWAEAIVGPFTAVQERTWNLSAIWQLRTPEARYWLKQLPGWLPNEPAALAWFAEVLPELAPRVLAVGAEGRELLTDVPGADLYDADLSTCLLITEQAHRFQVAALEATGQLEVPDRRGTAMADWIRGALAGWVQPPAVVELLAGLDERMTAVAKCGVPDTLTHGDAGPGNARRDGERIVFLDWSEAVLAHPGFDILVLADHLADHLPDAGMLLRAWADHWRRQVPGCEPERALELLRPVALLRSAALYAEFVARIEPTEHRYHRLDVEHLLEAVAVHHRMQFR